MIGNAPKLPTKGGMGEMFAMLNLIQNQAEYQTRLEEITAASTRLEGLNGIHNTLEAAQAQLEQARKANAEADANRAKSEKDASTTIENADKMAKSIDETAKRDAKAAKDALAAADARDKEVREKLASGERDLRQRLEEVVRREKAAKDLGEKNELAEKHWTKVGDAIKAALGQ